MKNCIGLMVGAVILVGIAACSHRGHSYGTSYSGTSYSTPSYSTAAPVFETPSVAVAVDKPPTGKPFPTPEAAMAALVEIAGQHDKAKVEEIFGTGAAEVLWSGDDVSDKEAAERVKGMIKTRVVFEDRSPEETVAVIGLEKWPFPFPLVKTSEGWRFDLEEGKDELLTRRIGRNELETIETMYEYVEAQKEYFAAGRDGNPSAYAQKVRSTAGKQDGLYWETKEGEPMSPLGEFVADARKEGYGPSANDQPRPYHGYYYKILTGQGASAPGGKKSYLDAKGLMTKGYAGIAWPAEYGNSGIMTFLVSNTGVLFEKDLGEQTESLAPAVTEYDPDKSWKPTARKPLPDEN